MGGIDNIYMPVGSKVLYLGAASGTTVSHVSDLVGPVSTLGVCLYQCVKYETCSHKMRDTSQNFTSKL